MSDTTYKLTVKELRSDQDIRWCPGCGDHAIMNAIQHALVELNIPKENLAFVSGIGCSSRFPYYMSTYGFHGIHGRASAIASGVKIANPELSVWQITGDGDALAIGGNHFIHTIRRNVNINIILFNNQIYGLTKGQYSPTSNRGFVTKTSPYGTVEEPFNTGELVIGAQGKFFARTIDSSVKLSTEIYIEAGRYEGTSVVEVLQNCVIYNDKIYNYLTDKDEKENRQLILHHDKPMIFGKSSDRGIILKDNKLKAVQIGENGITKDDILVHNAKEKNPGIHLMLANMQHPDYPVALGIIRSVDAQTYDYDVNHQMEETKAKAKIKCVDDLLNSGNIWEL